MSRLAKFYTSLAIEIKRHADATRFYEDLLIMDSSMLLYLFTKIN